MTVTIIQHVPYEGPGAIRQWAEQAGYPLEILNPSDLGDSLPLPKALILMGGPMSVHDTDEYPWLVVEKRYLTRVLEAGIPVLGICLGAQLIADGLGGQVVRAEQPEFGWWPVTTTEIGQQAPWTLPDTLTPLHWHGEQVILPPGATLLASSPACSAQIFTVGETVLGLQCHLEATSQTVAELLQACGQEATESASVYKQMPEDIEKCTEHFEQNIPILNHLLNQLFKLIKAHN